VKPVTEEHQLNVLDNRVLMTIFGLAKEDVTGEWRKYHNDGAALFEVLAKY
jgi:hypothetical protein